MWNCSSFWALGFDWRCHHCQRSSLARGSTAGWVHRAGKRCQRTGSGRVRVVDRHTADDVCALTQTNTGQTRWGCRRDTTDTKKHLKEEWPFLTWQDGTSSHPLCQCRCEWWWCSRLGWVCRRLWSAGTMSHWRLAGLYCCCWQIKQWIYPYKDTEEGKL